MACLQCERSRVDSARVPKYSNNLGTLGWSAKAAERGSSAGRQSGLRTLATSAENAGPTTSRSPGSAFLRYGGVGSFRLRLRKILLVPGNGPIDAVYHVPRLTNPVPLARIAHEDGVHADVLQRYVILFRLGDRHVWIVFPVHQQRGCSHRGNVF